MEELEIAEFPQTKKQLERRIVAVNIVNQSRDILYFDWDFKKEKYGKQNLGWFLGYLNETITTSPYKVMETDDGLHLFMLVPQDKIESILYSLIDITKSDYSKDLMEQRLRISPKWSYNTGVIVSPAPNKLVDLGVNEFAYPYKLELYEKVDLI